MDGQESESDHDPEEHNEISTHDDDLENNIGTQSGMVEVERYTTLCIDKIGMSLYLWPRYGDGERRVRGKSTTATSLMRARRAWRRRRRSRA
jgi:hypothetical protein